MSLTDNQLVREVIQGRKYARFRKQSEPGGDNGTCGFS